MADMTVDTTRAARLLTREFEPGRRLESTSHASAPGDSVVIKGLASEACVSDDGRFVAFAAQASERDWYHNDSGRLRYDIFLKDRLNGELRRVTNGLDGADPNDSSFGVSISADGRYVVFASRASNLVENDTNRATDVFLYDRESHQTRLVSTAQDGTPANLSSFAPRISADGKVVAFISTANNLTAEPTGCNEKAVVKELATGRVEVVSRPTGGQSQHGLAEQISLSGDGSLVAFNFMGRSLDASVPQAKDDWGQEKFEPQVYLHNRKTGETRQVSRNQEGQAADGRCIDPTISRDGQRIAFASVASNLIAGDAAGMMAVYQASKLGAPEKVSGDQPGRAPTFSGDGRWIGWESRGQIELRSQEGELLTVDRPPAQNEYPLEGPPVNVAPQLSHDGNTVVFLTREHDRDTPNGMHSRIHTFDFEHARAQLNWVGTPEEGSATVSAGADAVVIGGVRLRRRGASITPS